MDEFATKIRKRAANALRQIYQQEPIPGLDPVLELIGCLLEDGAGGISSPPETEVTTEQWLAWNQLALEQLQQLARTLTNVLEAEQMELPTEPLALRQWAACLVLNTLERME